MKQFLPLLLCLAALTAAAQQVTVLERTRLLQGVEGPAYNPVLNADGTQLLFSSGQNSGLKLYSFGDNVVTRISDEPGAGIDAFWGGDGRVYYVSQQRRANGLVYRTGHCYDVAVAQSRVVLEPQHGAVRPMPATGGAALRGGASYASARDLGVAVTTQGSEVIISRGGKERRFSPVESHAGYLWASLSPDRSRVAFFAAGTGIVIIDLDGRVLARLGNYEMPCWYDNDYLVAQHATDDGHQFTSSQIVLLKADGTFRHALTAPTSMTMQPTCGGHRIVYTTIDGQLSQMKIQINP